MDENIVSILKNFGWTEGFRVPIANEENRALESKVEKIYEKQVLLTSNLNEYQNKLNLIKYYLNSVTEERKHYQEIYSSCKQQQIVETLSCKRIAAQQTVIKGEKFEISKKKKKLSQDNDDLRIENGKINRKISRLKNILNWGKELESIWVEFTNRGNERVDLLQNWQLKNDFKLEQVEVKRINLCCERDECDSLLQQKFRNLLEAECSMSKLSKLQKNLRKERYQSIEKWEWLVRIITSRDDEITRLSEETNILSEMSTNLKNRIAEKKNFYHEQTRCNIRADIDIRRKEIEFSNQITCNENLNSLLDQLESKIVDHRKNLFSLNVEISKNRTRIADTKNMIDQEAITVRKLTFRNEHAVEKLLQTKAFRRSVEERTKELARILLDEKSKLNAARSNCEKFEIQLQKQSFSLADSERYLSAYDFEIEELRRAKVRLDTDNRICQQQIERQNHVLSDLKQELIQLVKQMQRVKDDEINQMTDEQKKCLSGISAFHNYQIKIFDQVNKDVQRFQFETTVLEKKISNCAQQMNQLQSEKEKLLFQMDGFEQRLNAKTELNKQKLVSENITRTRVDYLENALATSTDKTLNLQKQKIEIGVLFHKHDLEMKATWNILANRKKLMNQEISNIKCPIEQIKKRIHQQMKRYDIINDGIKKDDKGVPLNAANYKIQLTKERYALLEKGDELDALVRKAEKEIQAMENTLTLLNVSNNICKRSSSTCDENAKEAYKYEEKKQQKLKLLTGRKKIEAKIEKTRNEISRHQIVLSVESLSKLDQLEKTKVKNEAEYAQIRRTTNAQLFKMDRVQSRIERMKKLLKTNRTDVLVLEQEFLTKHVFKLNKRVLQRITRLTKQQNELNISVHQYLTTKGINLPSTLRKHSTLLEKSML